MANLGSFAGGMAQGIQSGSRLRMAQDEMDSNNAWRERQGKLQDDQMAITKRGAERADTEFAWRLEDREKATQMNTELQAAMKTHFGENPAETLKKDPTAAFRFGVDKVAIGLKYGKTDPKEILDIASQVKTYAQTEEAQQIMAALSGNGDAAMKILPKFGFDPATSRVAQNEAGRYILTDGKNTKDVSMLVMGLGNLKAAEFIEAMNKSGGDALKTAADIKYKNAAAGAQGAAAGNYNASAEQTRTETGNLKKGLPKDGVRAGATKDLTAKASELLMKDNAFTMQPASVKVGVNRYVQYLIEQGSNPSDAVLTALAELEKNQTKGR